MKEKSYTLPQISKEALVAIKKGVEDKHSVSNLEELGVSQRLINLLESNRFSFLFIRLNFANHGTECVLHFMGVSRMSWQGLKPLTAFPSQEARDATYLVMKNSFFIFSLIL